MQLQFHQSLYCLHIRSMDIDAGWDQNLGLSSWPLNCCMHTCTKNDLRSEYLFGVLLYPANIFWPWKCCLLFTSIVYIHIHFSLDAWKPVFRSFRTTKVQTSLRIHADWSAPLLFIFRKVPYLNLQCSKWNFNFLASLELRRLVWVSLCRKPWRQVLSHRGPFVFKCTSG